MIWPFKNIDPDKEMWEEIFDHGVYSIFHDPKIEEITPTLLGNADHIHDVHLNVDHKNIKPYHTTVKNYTNFYPNQRINQQTNKFIYPNYIINAHQLAHMKSTMNDMGNGFLSFHEFNQKIIQKTGFPMFMHFDQNILFINNNNYIDFYKIANPFNENVYWKWTNKIVKPWDENGEFIIDHFFIENEVFYLESTGYDDEIGPLSLQYPVAGKGKFSSAQGNEITRINNIVTIKKTYTNIQQRNRRNKINSNETIYHSI